MVRRFTSRLLIFAALALAPPLWAGETCAQQVEVRTSDGVRLNGVFYHALGKPRASGLLLVHGFGSEFYSGYFPQLADAAAKAGYATLAVNMRDHGAGPKTTVFEDNEKDIRAAIEYLRTRGAEKVVLLGQSMGSNRVLFYQATSGDPSIVATVLISGPGNLFDWNVWQLGKEKAQASVDEALKMTAAGQGRALMLVDLGPLGKALYTPQYLLSLRGPEAKSDPFQNLRKISNKLLLIQGKADKLVPPDMANRLVRATKSGTGTVMYLEGDHQFNGKERDLSQVVLKWLAQAAP